MLEVQNFALNDPIELQSEDFALEAGQIVALIGPSGAGKSVFFKTLAGFNPLLKGQIRWQGRNIAHFSPAKRPISYLFQSHNLFIHLSVRQNIALGVSPNLKLSKSEWFEVDEIINALNLTNIQNQRPRTISGGQAARTALARILLQKRDIVLFDEPLSALGPAQTEEVRAVINARLKSENRLILFVSHQIADWANWSDQILWLSNRRIHAPAFTKSFIQNPNSDAKTYFGSEIHKYL